MLSWVEYGRPKRNAAPAQACICLFQNEGQPSARSRDVPESNLETLRRLDRSSGVFGEILLLQSISAVWAYTEDIEWNPTH